MSLAGASRPRVGVEPKSALEWRNFLIPLNAQIRTPAQFAIARYTPGTRATSTTEASQATSKNIQSVETAALHSCESRSSCDHFVTTNATCEAASATSLAVWIKTLRIARVTAEVIREARH